MTDQPANNTLKKAVAEVIDQGAAPSSIIKTAEGFKTLDVNGLYEVRNFTDLTVGDIRAVTPVVLQPGGDPAPDPSGARPARFFSNIMVTVNNVPANVAFEIAGATTLAEAIEKFPAAAEAAGRDHLKKMQEARTRRPLIMPPMGGGLPS